MPQSIFLTRANYAQTIFPTPPPKAKSPNTDLSQINDLIRIAKQSWLGLIAYLAFIGVTLIGVTDPDFFLVERETQLPLIGVTIPTARFFGIAPVLGAMLYAYMHYYLIHLWDALAEAEKGTKPLGDRITPWLVADFALSLRNDGAVRPRPLRWIANLTTRFLVFFAAPAVLAYFWWRSMPKHDEVLTVLSIGLPLTFALYAGVNSWVHLSRAVHRSPPKTRAPRPNRFAWGLIAVTLALVGWFRTEGTLNYYAETYLGMNEDAIAAAPWSGTPFPGFLARAQLAGVQFSQTPPDWQDYDQAERAFRKSWCVENGLNQFACGPGPYSDQRPHWSMYQQRWTWCKTNFPEAPVMKEQICEAEFLQKGKNYRKAWKETRRQSLTAFPSRDLSGLDLRNAGLWNARMEGANLFKARMEGANLVAARMEGVILLAARMEGADLTQARMEGADLSGAHMEGANLSGAQMEGANLLAAHMEGANLWGARFDETTSFENSDLSKAALNEVDLSILSLTPEQVTSAFGDGSVILPGGITPQSSDWPAHWPKQNLSWIDFLIEWKKWRDNPETYTPPETYPPQQAVVHPDSPQPQSNHAQQTLIRG